MANKVFTTRTCTLLSVSFPATPTTKTMMPIVFPCGRSPRTPTQIGPTTSTRKRTASRPSRNAKTTSILKLLFPECLVFLSSLRGILPRRHYTILFLFSGSSAGQYVFCFAKPARESLATARRIRLRSKATYPSRSPYFWPSTFLLVQTEHVALTYRNCGPAILVIS